MDSKQSYWCLSFFHIIIFFVRIDVDSITSGCHLFTFPSLLHNLLIFQTSYCISLPLYMKYHIFHPQFSSESKLLLLFSESIVSINFWHFPLLSSIITTYNSSHVNHCHSECNMFKFVLHIFLAWNLWQIFICHHQLFTGYHHSAIYLCFPPFFYYIM